ncbi:MAG: restriction endonuclease subunit S [Desulfamplus sp.]|nr:restriction endonuclease subunit S [Desulfamplus sp.]
MKNRTLKLSDIATIKNGSTPDTNNSQYFDGDIIWITPKDLSDQNQRYIYKGARNITKEGLSSCSASLLPKNTILLSSRAPIGLLSIAGIELCTNQGFKNIILDTIQANPEFIYYYLKTQLKFITLLGSGTTFKEVSKASLDKFEINIPDITSQQKIASVLSSLDAKIELNNRINAELEAMAKTLYDYWFVQFNFPDKNGKPYKLSGGKMVWNEELKREIPEGWEVGNLSDIANITMGQSPRGESYNENREGIIFFQGCTDFGNRFPSIRQYTNEPTRFAKEGDILLSVRAPVGTINIANKDCCIGRGLAALNSKDGCITYLWGVMMNLKQIFDRRNVDGTTFGSITKDDLFSLKIIKPTKDILNWYHSLINPAFHKQNKIELENIQLSELRDFLLPMLMNGQVKVV